MKSRTATNESAQTLVAEPNVLAHSLADDGTFPNSKLPLLIYRRAVMLPKNEPAVLERLFASNHWSNSWRNGIYPYHHVTAWFLPRRLASRTTRAQLQTARKRPPPPKRR